MSPSCLRPRVARSRRLLCRLDLPVPVNPQLGAGAGLVPPRSAFQEVPLHEVPAPSQILDRRSEDPALPALDGPRDQRHTSLVHFSSPIVWLRRSLPLSSCPDERQVLHVTQAGRVLELFMARLDPVHGDPAMPFAQCHPQLPARQVQTETPVHPTAEPMCGLSVRSKRTDMGSPNVSGSMLAAP